MKRTIVHLLLAATALGVLQARAAWTAAVCDAGATAFAPGYTACAGAFDGNDGSDAAFLGFLDGITVFGDGGWAWADKVEAEDSWTGPSFTVFGAEKGTGTIVFEPGVVDGHDIVLSLKASNYYSLYYWEAELGTDVIRWSTDGVAVKPGKKAGTGGPELSHVSLFLRKATTVPGPDTLALLALGGIALVARRAVGPDLRRPA